MMIMDELITELPSKDIVEIPHLDDNQNSSNNIHFIMSTNNDFLIQIDPDHNSSSKGVEKQCKYYYDTLNEFNKAMSFQDNISILHTNICSSEHNLNDFMYYVNNLDIKFYFIGETWATKHNDHLLNMSNFNREQCIHSNKKGGGGTNLYIHNDIQYKTRIGLSLPKQQHESIFIEPQSSAQAEIQLLENFTNPVFKN